MQKIGDYELVLRWLEPEGWKSETLILEGLTFAACGRVASSKAKELDAKYGDEHYWNVMLYDHPRKESGAYYELFHGRTE